ncbi:hypothetical protein KSP40_PGU008146 [Platanthera guangdongensis]|uniref:Uncharacterized protein n=1 Tax=Platanthera guangdongensis TaxID=2320717 RepID=A0ABR2MG15_9ASPA
MAAVSSITHSSIFVRDPVLSFPTPKEMASKTTTKKKKRKGAAIPLSVFTTNTYVGPRDAHRDPYFEPRDIAADQMLFLPTSPHEHTLGELKNTRIGGGFHSYGGGSPRRFNEEVGSGLPPSRASDLAMHSRVDEVDNRASVKKSYDLTMGSGRNGCYAPLGNAASSKADEVDNWSSIKRLDVPPSRYSGFGSGFQGWIPTVGAEERALFQTVRSEKGRNLSSIP